MEGKLRRKAKKGKMEEKEGDAKEKFSRREGDQELKEDEKGEDDGQDTVSVERW